MSQTSFSEKFFHFCINYLGYFLSCYYGLTVSYRLIKRWLKNRSDRFWEVKPRELPPACLNDPVHGNHAYIQIKNVKLHYVEKGDRNKPLMLFLHGFPEFWYSWRHQLKEFSNDYWTVAVDMRGYGDSEKPVGKDKYSIEYLVDDVKNLIHALGRKKCTLVAHDWGGIIAWYFVLLNSQMIDSYIIMNSAHPTAYRKVLNKRLSQIKKSWYIFFYQLPYLPELTTRMDDLGFMDRILRPGKSHPHISDDDIEAFKFTFGKSGAFTPPLNYYRANYMLQASKTVKDFGTNADFPPGLILFGEKDIFIDKEIQEESVRLVKNGSLAYIPEANHFVQQDTPVQVNTEMRRFLNANTKNS